MPQLKLALSSTASGEESKITPFNLRSGIKPKLESPADVIIKKHVTQSSQEVGYFKKNLSQICSSQKASKWNPGTCS